MRAVRPEVVDVREWVAKEAPPTVAVSSGVVGRFVLHNPVIAHLFLRVSFENSTLHSDPQIDGESVFYNSLYDGDYLHLDISNHPAVERNEARALPSPWECGVGFALADLRDLTGSRGIAFSSSLAFFVFGCHLHLELQLLALPVGQWLISTAFNAPA